MALVQELMAAGTPAAAANQIGQDTPALALVATGVAQADALPLASSFSVFGTVAAGTGGGLPSAGAQQPYFIYNGGANALLVYPSLGQSINAGAPNAAFSIPTLKSAIFIPAGVKWGAIASA
jgi:hypothetical protein